LEKLFQKDSFIDLSVGKESVFEGLISPEQIKAVIFMLTSTIMV